MMPLISIIIPVYNTEKYIGRCIDSVIAQSYSDWELILVDDGSTDGSGKICDEYAEKDERIRVFHKENGGVSSARNVGLDNANGEWVSFVDSDDWVSPNYLSDFFAFGAFKSDVMYSSGIVFAVKDGGFNTFFSYKDVVIHLDDKDSVKSNNVFANGCPVAKLFNRLILNENNIRFDVHFSLNEDHLFVTTYLCNVKSVRQMSAVNYFYWRDDSSSSLTHKKHSCSDNLVAAKALSKQLDVFCDKYGCNSKEILDLKDMKIFGAQQIVRAVYSTVGSDNQNEMLRNCIAVAKELNLNYSNYCDDYSHTKTIIRVLKYNNCFVIKTYLRYAPIFRKYETLVYERVRQTRILYPLYKAISKYDKKSSL